MLETKNDFCIQLENKNGIKDSQLSDEGQLPREQDVGSSHYRDVFIIVHTFPTLFHITKPQQTNQNVLQNITTRV